MIRRSWHPALLCLVASSATCAVAEGRARYELPVTRTLTLPPGPGSEEAAAVCSSCHSLDYVITQPRGKGAKFWQDSVNKMRSVYGAPLSDEDAATIASYLGRTFGDPRRDAHPVTPAMAKLRADPL